MVCWLFVGSASFASVFAYFVPRMDLAGVFLIGLALVAYDLWTQLRSRRRRI